MKFLIPQKQSGTGTIYDLRSEHYDRVIKGRGKFAVVAPAYYNWYSTHIKIECAKKAYIKACRKGYQGILILNEDGNFYQLEYLDISAKLIAEI